MARRLSTERAASSTKVRGTVAILQEEQEASDRHDRRPLVSVVRGKWVPYFPTGERPGGGNRWWVWWWWKPVVGVVVVERGGGSGGGGNRWWVWWLWNLVVGRGWWGCSVGSGGRRWRVRWMADGRRWRVLRRWRLVAGEPTDRVAGSGRGGDQFGPVRAHRAGQIGRLDHVGDGHGQRLGVVLPDSQQHRQVVGLDPGQTFRPGTGRRS